MATFAETYTDLLETINRPSSEADVLRAVKRAINNAILYLQRNQAFAYTERLNQVTYPANTLHLDLGTICGGTLRNMKSIQQVSASGKVQGKPLKIVSYDWLQKQRSNYERSHTPAFNMLDTPAVLTGFTIEDAYRTDRIVFLVGQMVGLYPKPTEDVYLVMNNNIWLPTLAADSDTNFFLTYCADAVEMIALKYLHIYLKLDSRFAVTQQQVNDVLAGLVIWDASTTSNSNSSFV